MTKPLDEMTKEELLEYDTSKDDNKDDTQDSEPVETQETDTETETPEDTPSDTDTETVDWVKEFESKELNRQYPGGIKELFERIPETNKYVNSLQEENKKLRDVLINKLEQKETPPPQTEDTLDEEALKDMFYENPLEALKKTGVVTKEDLQAIQSRLDAQDQKDRYMGAANTIAKYEDLRDIADDFRSMKLPEPGKNAVWDTMFRMIETQPGAIQLPLETKLNLFYDRAKAIVTKAGGNTKPKVPPVSQSEKDAARTTTLNRKPSGAKPLELMKTDELLAHAREHGLIDD